jgi:hypothetical protein
MDVRRLITEMIRQFFAHPAEFLTFNQLAHRIAGGDADVLHAIAEAKPDLFLITNNGSAAKLFAEAVREILRGDADLTTLHAITTPDDERVGGTPFCEHSSDEEILADLRRGSMPSEALVRNCCWRRICQVRGRNPGMIDAESWSEICKVKEYVRLRQNPRGF